MGCCTCVFVFVRISMSNVLTASVRVSAGYRLLLALFSIKPFTLIKSIDIRRTLSWGIINRYGATASPSRTLPTIAKQLGSGSWILWSLCEINKTEYLCFNREVTISNFNISRLKIYKPVHLPWQHLIN